MRILSAIFGLIFGLGFAGIGTMIALETAVPTYLDWRAMQQWQPAYATLIKISASDNDTEATYRYHVDDVAYRNDRVYVSTSKDNIGSYHQTLYHKLRRLKDNHQPVRIWFNPDNPAESVIDRDMRWGFFALMSGFCSIFIVIGLAVSYACLKKPASLQGGRNKPSLTELKRLWRQKQAEGQTNESFLEFVRQQALEYQNATPTATDSTRSPLSKPWLNKKEWRENQIRSGAKTKMIVMWVFGLAWSAVSSPILFVIEDELKRQNYAALFGLLFPLIGIIVLVMAWRMTREWMRFGVIELQMDPFPGSIGGHVGGRLSITNTRDYRAEYSVKLACLYSYVSGTGDSRSRHETEKWSEQGIAKVESSGHGVRLEFRFDVPEGLPESDVDQTDKYHYWLLSVHGECEGHELKRDYNIPVFNTRTHSHSIRHDNSAQAAELNLAQDRRIEAAINRGDFEQTVLARALQYSHQGQKHIFYFPMFRNKLLTLFSLFFAAGFDFAAYQINFAFADEGVMAVFMLVFSIPFALVGLVATIAAVYLPFNNLTVTLSNRQITVMRRLLFIPIYYRSFSYHDIRRIEIKSIGSTGATRETKMVKHYKLVAVTKNQSRFTIAEDIDGDTTAQHLKHFIADRLGIAA